MDAAGSQGTLAASGMTDGAGQQQHAITNLAHMEWCASRYRSYRAEDNSYRSYSGERRSCASPYEQPENPYGFGRTCRRFLRGDGQPRGSLVRGALPLLSRRRQHLPALWRRAPPVHAAVGNRLRHALTGSHALRQKRFTLCWNCSRRHDERQNCRALKKLLCARHGIQIRTELPGIGRAAGSQAPAGPLFLVPVRRAEQPSRLKPARRGRRPSGLAFQTFLAISG